MAKTKAEQDLRALWDMLDGMTSEANIRRLPFGDRAKLIEYLDILLGPGVAWQDIPMDGRNRVVDIFGQKGYPHLASNTPTPVNNSARDEGTFVIGLGLSSLLQGGGYVFQRYLEHAEQWKARHGASA